MRNIDVNVWQKKLITSNRTIIAVLEGKVVDVIFVVDVVLVVDIALVVDVVLIVDVVDVITIAKFFIENNLILVFLRICQEANEQNDFCLNILENLQYKSNFAWNRGKL
jgi:hypothetical protein